MADEIRMIKICKNCKHDSGTIPCKLGHRQLRNVANGCKDFDGELYPFNRSKAKTIYPVTWQ